MCGCFRKRVSVNIICCCVLWFLSFVVCDMFLWYCFLSIPWCRACELPHTWFGMCWCYGVVWLGWWFGKLMQAEALLVYSCGMWGLKLMPFGIVGLFPLGSAPEWVLLRGAWIGYSIVHKASVRLGCLGVWVGP